MIVVDEQPGAEADQLPENEHHEKIVGEHDAEHREHEEGQAAEEPRPGLVVVHVAEREDVDQETDKADHEEHQRREVVELDAELDDEITEPQPLRRGIKPMCADELQRKDGDGAGGAGGNP